ncbi:TPA: 50S ribosomal protein L6 [Candidatus Acetothermia bacterium]|nr:50S ribosomal protein L6 [Candidatus Acetothermia bacterium]HAZ30668.1 50S ribosomal protein L6 [Candidatus Acetothermia bacterium]
MSKIGRKPIRIPDGVAVTVQPRRVTVRGPHGTLDCPYEPEYVAIGVEGGEIRVERKAERAPFRARHGLYRALLANMVRGVTEKWQKELEIQGLGYRARAEGKALVMELGYSHPVRYEVPDGIEVAVPDPARIVVRGIDNRLVGQVAADIRAFHPPEPYRGTGIRYRGEEIVRKAGKLGAKG